MSDTRNFTLGGMAFEVAVCTDPSTGTLNAWVYRTDIHPRATVATGKPDSLTLTPAFADWDVTVLEQAAAGSLAEVT